MSKYVTVSTTNTWDTKYATVSNTWAIKDTVTSYFTIYTLCTGALQVSLSETYLGPRKGAHQDIQSLKQYLTWAHYGAHQDF